MQWMIYGNLLLDFHQHKLARLGFLQLRESWTWRSQPGLHRLCPTNPTKMGPQPALPHKNSISYQRAIHDRNGIISMAIVALIRTSIGLASHIDLSERTWALSTLFCLIGILSTYLLSTPQQVQQKSVAICLIFFLIFARPLLSRGNGKP